jgi:hypothetical protein
MLYREQHPGCRGEERMWSIADMIVRSAMPFTETADLLAALEGRLNM